jgi:hypothetical protein
MRKGWNWRRSVRSEEGTLELRLIQSSANAPSTIGRRVQPLATTFLRKETEVCHSVVLVNLSIHAQPKASCGCLVDLGFFPLPACAHVACYRQTLSRNYFSTTIRKTPLLWPGPTAMATSARAFDCLAGLSNSHPKTTSASAEGTRLRPACKPLKQACPSP